MHDFKSPTTNQDACTCVYMCGERWTHAGQSVTTARYMAVGRISDITGFDVEYVQLLMETLGPDWTYELIFYGSYHTSFYMAKTGVCDLAVGASSPDSYSPRALSAALAVR